jgi:hypothetical protein
MKTKSGLFDYLEAKHLMVSISRTLEVRDGFQELQGRIHAFLEILTIRC